VAVPLMVPLVVPLVVMLLLSEVHQDLAPAPCAGMAHFLLRHHRHRHYQLRHQRYRQNCPGVDD
jgi:hypothetical protein